MNPSPPVPPVPSSLTLGQQASQARTPAFPSARLAASVQIKDDRDNLQPADRILLIIENDIPSARLLVEVVRQQDFKAIVAVSSETGLAMAREFNPSAIILALQGAAIGGWTMLDRLKHDVATRHIPIYVISQQNAQHRSLQFGAMAYLQKPLTRELLVEHIAKLKALIESPVKKLLIVDSNAEQQQTLINLISNPQIQITAVETPALALTHLKAERFDGLVLALHPEEMTGLEAIEGLQAEAGFNTLPILIYSPKTLTQQQEGKLTKLASTMLIKSARSPEGLLDLAVLFLHQPPANLSESQRQMLEALRQTDPILAGKKVLVVDDDVRNIYALTSILERHHLDVIYAENGREAIAKLQTTEGIDIVLMDVMMPEMDGYETMQAIRNQAQFTSLPMIALTAKAMQGDREKCLAAGASDYITKPVDTDQLLSLLRVWLYR